MDRKHMVAIEKPHTFDWNKVKKRSKASKEFARVRKERAVE
jgi:hypothetical protein